jgi:protein CpxP
MRTLIQSGSADEAAIRAQAAKVAAVEADLAIQRAQMAKQFRAILTPEQVEKFKAVQKEKDARFDKFREHMHEKFDKPGADK